MSRSATEKRPGQTKNRALPFYAAGCYPVPIRFLYGTAAEINFWDVVYFRAYENENENENEAGGGFDTSTQELVELMGLSRQMIGRLRRHAVERGELIEYVSWVSGHRFLLRVSDFDRLAMAKGVVWKPLGYVHNGWHRVVTPAIPKRVLNLYLQQPRRQVYCLDPQYIAAKCKRRFPDGGTRAVAPLNSADVGQALRLLVRLGLLLPDGDGFRIDWEAFSRPAPPDGPFFDAPDPREHPLFREAAAVDPRRAEQALELMDVGHYDIYQPETHFPAILRDLAYVRADDYPTLKAKVYRHRNRPPGPNRWRNTWRAFQYELKRRIAQVRGPKSILYLGEATSCVCTLALDIDIDVDVGIDNVTRRILAIRVVSRVEWPWHLEETRPSIPTVQLELWSGDQRLFARTVCPSDAEVRYTLHPDEWPDPAAPLAVAVRCDRPLPGVRVEAWLEARLRR
jgi:hypothetical protein